MSAESERRVARGRRARRLRLGHRRAASARAAITPAARRDRRRRPGASCWSTASRPGSRRRPGRFALSSQRYAPDVVHPDGACAGIESFDAEPWPQLDVPARRRHARSSTSCSCAHGDAGRVRSRGACCDRAGGVRLACGRCSSGRDYHALHHENDAFRFDADGRRRARGLAALRGAARRSLARSQRRLPPRARLVPSFLYPRSARAASTTSRTSASPGTFRFDSPRGEARAACWRRRARRLGAGAGAGSRVARGALARERTRAPPFRARAARSRRRRLRRAARRGQDDHRRLSVVHRLGPRHVHRAARPVPRDRPRSTTRARSSLEWAGAVSRGHAAQPLPRRRRRARVQLGRRVAVVRGRGARVPARRRARGPRSPARRGARLDARGRRDPRRLRARHALRHPRRRATGCSRAASRACSSPGWTRRSATGWSRRASASRSRCRRSGSTRCASAPLRRRAGATLRARLRERSASASGTRTRGCLLRRRRRRPRARAPSTDASGRTRSSRSAACRSRCSMASARARVVDAVERGCWTPLGPALARPGEPGYVGALRGRRARARRRVPPGHGVAVARRPVRRGWVRVRGGRPSAASEARERFLAPLLAHSTRQGSATSPRSPTATRRTRRAAVRSRRGRWRAAAAGE